MVSIAVVGYGYWGPNLARNAQETDGAALAAIVDRDEGRRDAAARRHPGVPVHADIAAVLVDGSVDAVAIATPVATHYALALEALCAGKHVLVEKPVTETADQARRLVEQAERRRLVLMVDHTFVYTGAVRRIAQLMAAGDLGELYYYDSTRANLGLFQRDVNVISDLAVHDLSILDHVLPEAPVAVSAVGVRHFAGEPENLAHLNLIYASGAIAHVGVSWLAPVKVRQALICGSRRMVVYDDMEPSEKVKVYDKGVDLRGDPQALQRARIDYRAGDMWAPRLDVTEALRTELAHFVDCVSGGARPLTDGRMGWRVVRIVEAATESMRRRGDPIALDASPQPAAAEAGAR